MTSNETEKRYKELQKSLDLPEFLEIDEEFELSDLEETRFLLRAIIRRIAEKLDFCSKMIEEILQPDTSNLYAMHETRFFDEAEKKQMYETYTKLMNFSRHSIEASLDNNAKAHADFIIRVSNEWKQVKQELLEYAGKMRACWKTEVDVKEDIGYLG